MKTVLKRKFEDVEEFLTEDNIIDINQFFKNYCMIMCNI